jgi:hypothetical protein
MEHRDVDVEPTPDITKEPLPDLQTPPPPRANELEIPDERPGEIAPRPIDDLPVPEGEGGQM